LIKQNASRKKFHLTINFVLFNTIRKPFYAKSASVLLRLRPVVMSSFKWCV